MNIDEIFGKGASYLISEKKVMKTIFQAKMLHWDVLLEMILLFGLHQVPKLMKL